MKIERIGFILYSSKILHVPIEIILLHNDNIFNEKLNSSFIILKPILKRNVLE